MRFARKRLDHANSSECFLHRHHHLAHAFLFTLHRFPGAAPINAQRQQTGWKKNQSDHSEFPIHQQKHTDCAHNGDRLLKNVAADSRQSHLHDPRIIGDPRH